VISIQIAGYARAGRKLPLYGIHVNNTFSLINFLEISGDLLYDEETRPIFIHFEHENWKPLALKPFKYVPKPRKIPRGKLYFVTRYKRKSRK